MPDQPVSGLEKREKKLADRRESGGGKSGGAFEPFRRARRKTVAAAVDRRIAAVGHGQREDAGQAARQVAQDMAGAAMVPGFVASERVVIGASIASGGLGRGMMFGLGDDGVHRPPSSCAAMPCTACQPKLGEKTVASMTSNNKRERERRSACMGRTIADR